jgi:hypothetical protein
MRSVRFEAALGEFVQEAAEALQADVKAGAEVGFELEPRARRGGAALYCYRALTGSFIAERAATLERLKSHAEAARLLAAFNGLDRYLASAGVELGPRIAAGARARAAIHALLEDVFREQSDFELRPERLQAAIGKLESAASAASTGELMLVATLHGMGITSAEVRLTKGLAIAHCDALEGLPQAAAPGDARAEDLVVVLALEDDDASQGPARGRGVLRDLLRALRLFGDGRVTLGPLAWARIGDGPWTTVALGTGGRPHGMLLVTPEQEDELRAFCNLVSRRAPHGNELAWALRRFELGCERDSALEGLSDHLLGLRVLLEPEGPASGLLAGRLAALCSPPGRRAQLTERIAEAVALEREVMAGKVADPAAAAALTGEIAEHLRALLRDVICGHLAPDLAALADELLLTPEPDSGEEVIGDPSESEEILDLLI